MFWFGSKGVLVVTEADHMKEILNNKEKKFPKREVNDFVRKLVGNGLVTLPDGDKWLKLRKLANHAFHGEGLKVIKFSCVDFRLVFEIYRNVCKCRVWYRG